MRLLSHPRTLPLLVAGTFFMELLDGTVIATALPQMARSFGVRPVDLSVGLSAYLLTLALLLPASGYLAERFGQRRIFCLAILIFTMASLACSLSTSLAGFTAARVVQGAGGAMMVPVGRLVVLRATPKADLMNAFATLTWPALAAPILAPPLGGLITTYASWRWIFYINLPLGLLALWLAARIVPIGEAAETRRFDALGFALTGLAGLGLMAGAEMLGRDTDWPWALLILAGGGLLGGAAIVHIKRHPASILDLDALRVASFSASVLGGSLYRAAVSTLPFLLPLLFQVGFGWSAFQSGLMVLALFVGNVGIKPFTTPILQRFGFRTVLIGNGLLMVLMILLCGLITPTTPLPITLAILAGGGMTRSMGFTAINTLAFADIAPSRMAGANTLFSTAQQMAVGLGIAFGALALRVGQLWQPHDAGHVTLGDFRIAFVLVGLVALASLADAVALPAEAGAAVAGG